MKNVQVIDGAVNSTFEVYAVGEDVFEKLFPGGVDIAFAEEFSDKDPLWRNFYLHRVKKSEVQGIHGTLHLNGKAEKERFFPGRSEQAVIG